MEYMGRNNTLKFGKLLKNIILDIIIVMLVIFVIGIIVSSIQLKVKKRDYINIFGYSLFEVETGSMAKTIEIGDIIIVKLTDDIKENDIITFKNGKEFITHRIINLNEDSIITKGDNNNSEDEPINKENVIGKVVYIFNNVNVWKKVFTDIKVIIPISITAILIFVLTAYKEKIGEDNV